MSSRINARHENKNFCTTFFQDGEEQIETCEESTQDMYSQAEAIQEQEQIQETQAQDPSETNENPRSVANWSMNIDV